MNKILIKYFKAFKDELTIELESKNLLIYGENGSGKSSIYEALKIVFFKNILERSIPEASTPEEQGQLNKDFWEKYNNRNANKDFHIEVNETKYSDFVTADYQVFMISYDEISFVEKINLVTLLNNAFFETKGKKIDDFCIEYYEYIETEVNEVLKIYNNGLEIEIDQEDDFTIKIIDSVRGLESKTEVKKYFNEGKLNLIMLLLLFNSIWFLIEGSRKKILLLDDIITSLDVSNRTILMKYIFGKFSNFQIIFFTHSVNFYNFILYLINEIYNTNEKWKFANIYEYRDESKIYEKKAIESVDDIKSAYNEDPGKIEEIGNKVRQKFEILLYEYSKLLMIGAVEESNKILSRIENTKSLYFKNNKNASNLVDELEMLLNNGNTHKLKERLKSKIAGYKYNDFDNFKKTLSDLKLYRKITMHPMSHGVIGKKSFTVLEVEKSLDLLQMFEKHLKDLVDKKI